MQKHAWDLSQAAASGGLPMQCSCQHLPLTVLWAVGVTPVSLQDEVAQYKAQQESSDVFL